MNVDYIIAETVPERTSTFEMNPQTKQLILRFESLGVGELFEVRIKEDTDLVKTMRRLRGRCDTAAKHSKGEYRLAQRGSSIFVRRVS